MASDMANVAITVTIVASIVMTILTIHAIAPWSSLLLILLCYRNIQGRGPGACPRVAKGPRSARAFLAPKPESLVQGFGDLESFPLKVIDKSFFKGIF